MDLHYKQEISVGLLVITGVALFAAGLAWLSGTSIGVSAGSHVPVRFSDIQGLTVGAPVLISGLKVGQVENIVLEDVGRVTVYFSVKPEFRPHSDARVEVVSADLFGAKVINYTPGLSPEMLRSGQMITGINERGFTDHAGDLTSRASEALTAAQGILSQRTADDIHQTMVAAARALDVITKVGSGPGVAEATAAVRTVQTLAARVDSLLGNPAVRKSVDQLDELTTSLNEMAQGLAATTKAMASLLQKMDSAQGSLGRAMTDSSLYVQTQKTLKSMQDLMDDIRARPERYIRVKVF